MKSWDSLIEEHVDWSDDYRFAHPAMRDSIDVAAKEFSNQFIDLIFIGKQKVLYKALFYEPSISTGAISGITGIESRNVSTQLNNMCRTGLVGFQRVGKLKYWHRVL